MEHSDSRYGLQRLTVRICDCCGITSLCGLAGGCGNTSSGEFGVDLT